VSNVPTFVDCAFCHNKFAFALERCPHCAQPGLFANVRAADNIEERSALNRRYKEATTDAAKRGVKRALKDFEKAVKRSQAVMARSLGELQRLATSDNELYATYHQLVEAGLRLPAGGKWDILRVLTDDALFPGYKQHIRFAALSLNRIGLHNYGECSLVLREKMIAHRASVFEENSVMWMANHRINLTNVNNLPKVYRATWNDRAKLVVAKQGNKIQPNMPSDSFAALLLQQGTAVENDQFIEVHIWGPMTMRTVEHATIKQPQRPANRVILKALREKLQKAGVTLEVN
jgi:hypothetical protein